VELKDRRIRSNVLSPGPIKTPLVDLQPPDAIARLVATIPMINHEVDPMVHTTHGGEFGLRSDRAPVANGVGAKLARPANARWLA
jgi:NAD(P)-dependent dehydrogenase (short-subunit alcohol dehydrogenase family)